MKKIISLVLVLVIILSCSFSLIVFGENYSLKDINNSANETINSRFGLNNNEKIEFTEDFLKVAGSTSGDWYVIALKALEIDANYNDYLNALSVYVKKAYEKSGQLHPVKATEWHRILLAVLACGGNPENFAGVNLIADGTYGRNDSNPVDRQGINGLFWGLISLDSGNFIIPSNAELTREVLIQKILDRQLDDGGFALNATKGDADITSMAITSLSSYYDRENVKVALDKALDFLSENQLANGGYQSFGIENSESVSQVVIALCSMKINPMVDERFIKNGVSVFSALEAYKANSGEYYHMQGETKVNVLSTQQALLAMGAVSRFLDGSQRLYAFEVNLSNNGSQADGKQPDDITDGNSNSDFTDKDREQVNNLKDKSGASDLNTVDRLIEKVEQAKPDDYQEIKSKLDDAKKESEKTLEKVNKVASDISKLDNNISWSDKDELSKIKEICNGLSENDLKLIENYEVLERLDAQISTNIRTVVIFIFVSLLISGAVVILVIRRVKKRKILNED